MQLQLEFTEMISVAPVEYQKPPRPEHKPYEGNAIYLQDYFILQGAFFDWTRTFGAFSHFLGQWSKDPKLQNARDWKWEGKTLKVPAYHWREFEKEGAVYAAWVMMFERHLIGYTTDHFKNREWHRDPITEIIEDGMCASQGFMSAFFETLRGFGYFGNDLDKAWASIERKEKLCYT